MHHLPYIEVTFTLLLHNIYITYSSQEYSGMWRHNSSLFDYKSHESLHEDDNEDVNTKVFYYCVRLYVAFHIFSFSKLILKFITELSGIRQTFGSTVEEI